MKTEFHSRLSPRRLLSLGLLGLGLTLNAPAQSVFQAHLTTPPDGGGAQLSLGKFYLRVEAGQVDFVAIIFPFGPVTDSLNPVLSVPASSLNFSLGTGTRTAFHGLYTIVDHNPFLPREPWLPAGYDEDGRPYYIDAPVIRTGDLYTGHFALPPGFEDELRAGRGSITINPSLGGIIAAVPEPTTLALTLLAGLGWGIRSRWQKVALDRLMRRERAAYVQPVGSK